jgi:hypothetical protein
MNIPKEIVNRMADEIYKELEEEAKQSGKKITFDDMEKAVLFFRQRMGEMTMQQVINKRESEKQEKKLLKMWRKTFKERTRRKDSHKSFRNNKIFANKTYLQQMWRRALSS